LRCVCGGFRVFSGLYCACDSRVIVLLILGGVLEGFSLFKKLHQTELRSRGLYIYNIYIYIYILYIYIYIYKRAWLRRRRTWLRGDTGVVALETSAWSRQRRAWLA